MASNHRHPPLKSRKRGAINARIPESLEQRINAVAAKYPHSTDKTGIVIAALTWYLAACESEGRLILAEESATFGRSAPPHGPTTQTGQPGGPHP